MRPALGNIHDLHTARNMLRSDLVDMVAADLGDANVADDAVKFVFEVMIAKLAKGGRIELRGFGAFSIRSSDARQAKNPRTGELVDLPPRSRVFFRPGLTLRAAVARGGATA